MFEVFGNPRNTETCTYIGITNAMYCWHLETKDKKCTLKVSPVSKVKLSVLIEHLVLSLIIISRRGICYAWYYFASRY